jgi:hypothetical protein
VAPGKCFASQARWGNLFPRQRMQSFPSSGEGCWKEVVSVWEGTRLVVSFSLKSFFTYFFLKNHLKNQSTWVCMIWFLVNSLMNNWGCATEWSFCLKNNFRTAVFKSLSGSLALCTLQSLPGGAMLGMDLLTFSFQDLPSPDSSDPEQILLHTRLWGSQLSFWFRYHCCSRERGPARSGCAAHRVGPCLGWS